MRLAPLFATFLLLPLPAYAAELAINPGLWETTMTRTDPMSGQPVTETRTECVTETKFDPADMMQDAQECQLAENALNGDVLTFRLECNMEGSQGVVNGRFQTDGQTGSGDMNIKINAGGIDMKMDMNWVAKRLGDC